MRIDDFKLLRMNSGRRLCFEMNVCIQQKISDLIYKKEIHFILRKDENELKTKNNIDSQP